MSDDTTRLRVKLGAAEIEYEGGADFLKSEVMPQICKMIEMVESRADLQRPAPALQIEQHLDTPQTLGNPPPALTTSTIAAKLKASSATDLAIAALAHLIIYEGKLSVSRQEILDEMKSAPLFFKQSFVNNHSNTMKVLQKSDRLRLVATDSYSLSNKERKELEETLREGGDDT
jgi:hypothetical protein